MVRHPGPGRNRQGSTVDARNADGHHADVSITAGLDGLKRMIKGLGSLVGELKTRFDQLSDMAGSEYSGG